MSARNLLTYVSNEVLKLVINTVQSTYGKQSFTNSLCGLVFLTCQCPKTPPNFDVNLAKLLETHEQEIADRRASAINLEHLVHELNEERRAKNDEILRLKVL